MVLSSTVNYQIEKRHIRKDRTVFWARVTVSLTVLKEPPSVFAIRIVEDINPQKKSEEAPQKYAKNLGGSKNLNLIKRSIPLLSLLRAKCE